MVEEEVYFKGDVGKIEGLYRPSNNSRAPLALVLHPHPAFGGTMKDIIVSNLYKTLIKQGFTTLRINFRGVGKSQGTYDNGNGEMTDAATALDWLQLQNPLSTINLMAGFSFGAWIAMLLIMRRPEVNNFIAISPPVNKYDFSFLSPCPIPGLILQGNKDSIVTEESVLKLANNLSKQKNSKVEYRIIDNADHYFREKIDVLNQAVNDYLIQQFSHQRFVKASVEDVAETEKEKTLQKIYLD